MRKGKKRFLAMLLAVGMILPNTSFVRAENDIGTTETTEVVTEVSTESGTENPSDDVEVVLLDNEGKLYETCLLSCCYRGHQNHRMDIEGLHQECSNSIIPASPPNSLRLLSTRLQILKQ